MQLLRLGIEALRSVLLRGPRSQHLGAVVGKRKLRVNHLHLDLRVKLLQPQLGLAIFEQRACLIGLSRAVANRHGDVEAGALVRPRAVHKVIENRAKTDAWNRSWSTARNCAIAIKC